MTPRLLLRRVARAEAVTWALLLAGMVLKYSDVTDLGVSVAGPIHGVVFVAYCVTTLVVAVDQRWGPGRLLLGLVASVPPFATLLFESYAERRGALADAWRLRSQPAGDAVERPVAWAVRHPVAGLLAGLAAVVVLTALALLLGPPGG